MKPGTRSIVALVCAMVVVSMGIAHSGDTDGPPTTAGAQSEEDAQPQTFHQHLQNLKEITEKERDTRNDSLMVGRVMGAIRDDVRKSRAIKWRHQMVGEKVQVEGFALGKQPLVTSQRVVYEGSRIFITGVNFAQHDAVGKLVRVAGNLRYNPPGIARQPGHTIRTNPFYYIEADTIEILDRVTDPTLMCPTLK